MTEHVYRHGRRYPRDEILRRHGPNARSGPLHRASVAKYSDIYGI
jgi:hypothetical protein